MESHTKVSRHPDTISHWHRSRRHPPYLSLFVGIATLFFALATASPAAENETLKLKHLRTLTNDFAVTTLVWHPDGKQLAVGQVLNKRIAIWDTQTGERVRTLEKEGGGVQSIAYSPDGKYLAVGREFSRHTKDHAHVHLYDAQSGALLHSFVPPSAPVKGDSNDASALAFSPNGKYLVASGYGSGRTAVVYEIATRKPIHTLSDSDEKGFRVINAIASSPDNRFIALGRVGGHIDVWSALDWKLLKRLEGQTGGIHALAFSPDGKYLGSGTDVGKRYRKLGNERRPWFERFTDDIVLWSVPTFEKAAEFPSRRFKHTPLSTIIESLQFTPNGRWLLVGAREKSVEVIDIVTGKTVFFKDDLKAIAEPAFSPNGKYLAIGLERDIEIHELITR